MPVTKSFLSAVCIERAARLGNGGLVGMGVVVGGGGRGWALGWNGAAHTGHQSSRGDEMNIFKGKN